VYGRASGRPCTQALRGVWIPGISSLGVLAPLAVAPSVGPPLVAAAVVSPSPCRRLLVGAVASAGVVNAVVVDVVM
jgi:hypothetical protein